MTAKNENLPDWERVLETLCRAQKVITDMVVVGGTSAAIHAGHRFSRDHDHVLQDLRKRYEQVLQDLESHAGWVTARAAPPVMILGALEGIETGVRQLIRSAPLETERRELLPGLWATIPTDRECLRIKVYLSLTRNATRDYLDVAALWTSIERERAIQALMEMDALYPQKNGDPWAVRLQVIRQLSDPQPRDLDSLDLGQYKGIRPPLDRWDEVRRRCASLASAVMERSLAMATGDTASLKDLEPRIKDPTPTGPLPGMAR